MLSTYPACFYKEKKGGYSVIFPDLNHLATQGDTLDDAFAMAVDCLAGYLYGAKIDGETVQQPSDLKSIDPDKEYDEYDDVLVNMVAVDVAEYARIHFERPIKKTLSIPKWINDTAVARKINFSKTLQEALLKKINA